MRQRHGTARNHAGTSGEGPHDRRHPEVKEMARKVNHRARGGRRKRRFWRPLIPIIRLEQNMKETSLRLTEPGEPPPLKQIESWMGRVMPAVGRQERGIMKYPIYHVDAFTGRLFTGNPAAVVFSESELTPETMQSIASENNLSETAFAVPAGEAYRIRWFTPTVEVDLCGHATLAAAHVIFNHLSYSGSTISFSSKSGPLYVRKDREILYLSFPADSIQAVEPPQLLIDGLGVTPTETYKGRDDYLAIFDDENMILSLCPDMGLLSKVPARGVIVTGPGHQVDFVSRFFAPQVGVSEDPVTGSAHTTLTPYWSKKLGKRHLQAKQISKQGGELVCQDLGKRIEIGGRAVTYLVGEISM